VVLLPAAFGHRGARREQVLRRRADERRGHQPEQRQCGEPPADLLRIQEERAVSVRLGQFLQRRSRIRNRDEVPAGGIAERGLHPRPEESFERGHFDGFPALARDEEPRTFRVHPGRRGLDCPLVRRVEHEQLRLAIRYAVHRPQDLAAHAASAHAKEVDRLDPFLARGRPEPRNAIQLVGHAAAEVEPAEPRGNRTGIRRFLNAPG
jgi:hypothetical protein